jgi:hypothetical protein
MGRKVAINWNIAGVSQSGITVPALVLHQRALPVRPSRRHRYHLHLYNLSPTDASVKIRPGRKPRRTDDAEPGGAPSRFRHVAARTTTIVLS